MIHVEKDDHFMNQWSWKWKIFAAALDSQSEIATTHSCENVASYLIWRFFVRPRSKAHFPKWKYVNLKTSTNTSTHLSVCRTQDFTTWQLDVLFHSPSSSSQVKWQCFARMTTQVSWISINLLKFKLWTQKGEMEICTLKKRNSNVQCFFNPLTRVSPKITAPQELALSCAHASADKTVMAWLVLGKELVLNVWCIMDRSLTNGRSGSADVNKDWGVSRVRPASWITGCPLSPLSPSPSIWGLLFGMSSFIWCGSN